MGPKRIADNSSIISDLEVSQNLYYGIYPKVREPEIRQLVLCDFWEKFL